MQNEKENSIRTHYHSTHIECFFNWQKYAQQIRLFKFKPDNIKDAKLDENGYILKEEKETQTAEM